MIVRAARSDDLTEGCGLRRELEGHDIAIWRVGGSVHAIANVCPHQHTPSLFAGTVRDGCLTCPVHGWTFSLASGVAVAGSGRVQVYPAHEEAGWVHVDLGEG